MAKITKTDLKKYFPFLEEDSIKEQLDFFYKWYSSVKKDISNELEKNKFKVENTIFFNKEKYLNNKKENIDNNIPFYDENKFIHQKETNKLKDFFPGYNKNLILALKNNIDLKTNEEILDEIIKNLLKNKSNFALIKTDYLSKWRNSKDFIKIAKSIWIFDKKIESVSNLKNKNLDPEKQSSAYNYRYNYKDWIWKKLLLTEEEIRENSIEYIENKIWRFIELAIDHIIKVLDSINNYKIEELKSEYFEQIHSKENKLSFFDLFKLYYKLEKEKKEYNDKPELKNHIKQINMWQFEIQRIFALTNSYLDRENNLTFQDSKEEQDVLISKLKELWTEELKKWYLNPIIRSDNLLYNFTNTKNLYWKNKDWKYLFSQKNKSWYKKTKINNFTIEWRFRNYDNQKHKINLVHVWTRIRKNPFSSVEKFLRKWFSSYNQILDHKWFIFVVDKKEKIEWLIKILECEIWTDKTSWLEETESMQIAWNNNTNSEYDSIKGILKVPYKWKLIKNFFDKLWEIIESKESIKFNKELKQLKKEWIKDSNIWKYEDLINKINDPELKKIYKDLKVKFWEKKYSMEVEIQIFDLENYIKAEIDENSPAFHWKYKDSQTLETFPIYFPKEIYWESTKNILKEELIKTEKYKHLKN